MVKIKTDQYAYIYPSEMTPLIKVKVINKVKGKFVQQINQNDPNGLPNKVASATSNMFRSCSSMLLNGKVNLSKVNDMLGHMTVSCAISKFN